MSDKIFQFTPEDITFNEYEPNQSYEQLVTVKNVTNTGKKIMILPLLGTRDNKKSVFSVENPKVKNKGCVLTYSFLLCKERQDLLHLECHLVL